MVKISELDKFMGIGEDVDVQSVTDAVTNSAIQLGVALEDAKDKMDDLASATTFQTGLDSRKELMKTLGVEEKKANSELQKTIAGFSKTAIAGKLLNKVLDPMQKAMGAMEKGFGKNFAPILNSLENLGEVLGRPLLDTFENWSMTIDDVTDLLLDNQDDIDNFSTSLDDLGTLFAEDKHLADLFGDRLANLLYVQDFGLPVGGDNFADMLADLLTDVSTEQSAQQAVQDALDLANELAAQQNALMQDYFENLALGTEAPSNLVFPGDLPMFGGLF